MAGDRLLSSALTACLNRAYESSQKGGTLIAEGVRDLSTHERLLEDPDGYRPRCCGRCEAKLHAHDLRVRLLLGDPAVSTQVRRYRCADRKRCGAVWQVLPALLARHLWRSWSTVEEGVEGHGRSEVPERTLRRWKQRLGSSARYLVALLGMAGERWAALVARVGLDGSRWELVRAWAALLRPRAGQMLAEVAGLVHRLQPGVRLM